MEEQSIKKIRMAIQEEFGHDDPETLRRVFQALLSDPSDNLGHNRPTSQEIYDSLPEEKRREIDFMMHM